MKVKICGITNIEDALNAVELGADALGFIFVKESPRYILPNSAQSIIAKLPTNIDTIGVFADITQKEIISMVNTAGIRTVQLHGSETPDFCNSLPLSIIKAFRVKEGFDINQLNQYPVSAFLLDTFTDGKFGGTGKTFNWSLAAEAKKFGRIYLAGGLNPQNIIEAVRIVQPYAVDVNSGVESAPGKKDKQKLKLFFENLKSINHTEHGDV